MPPTDPCRSDSPDTAPQMLGHRRLMRLLGKGGMSEVHLYYDPPAGVSVAVKLMSLRLAEDPTQMERFRRESKLSQKLNHPNIVRGIEAGRDPKTRRRFLVLEYVDGPSALALLERERRLSVNDVVHIGIAIARALQYLHQRKLVHRDIKPDNILLSSCGRAKLIDLGLVRWLTGDANQLTATSDGLGTSYYMPVEQALNSHFVDERSDIFALGATLYHLLTGEVPFPGADHREIMRKKEAGEYVIASQINKDVPAELDYILARMLARDPRRRYANCRDLLADLRRSGLAKGLPSYADLGMAVQPSQKPRPQPEPTRPDLRLRASQLRRSRNGDMWIIRYRDEKGAWEIRKATTTQLLNALRARRFGGPVFGARRPRHRFRPLGEFPEFHAYFPENAPESPRARGFCGRILARFGLGMFGAGVLAALAALAACGHRLLS